MALPPTWTMFGRYLPHRLLMLARMIDRETAKQLQSDFGLTVAEWRVLAFVASAGPSSASEVGAAFEADRAEVSRAVAKLVAASFIQKDQDPAHHKKMILCVTESGRALHLQVRQSRQSYYQEILHDLTDEDHTAFDESLNAIALRVDKMRTERD
jgi:DNA-binding MarR family transcriptional regulator